MASQRQRDWATIQPASHSFQLLRKEERFCWTLTFLIITNCTLLADHTIAGAGTATSTATAFGWRAAAAPLNPKKIGTLVEYEFTNQFPIAGQKERLVAVNKEGITRRAIGHRKAEGS